jgi:hypothetical protein
MSEKDSAQTQTQEPQRDSAWQLNTRNTDAEAVTVNEEPANGILRQQPVTEESTVSSPSAQQARNELENAEAYGNTTAAEAARKRLRALGEKLEDRSEAPKGRRSAEKATADVPTVPVDQAGSLEAARSGNAAGTPVRGADADVEESKEEPKKATRRPSGTGTSGK